MQRDDSDEREYSYSRIATREYRGGYTHVLRHTLHLSKKWAGRNNERGRTAAANNNAIVQSNDATATKQGNGCTLISL